MPVGRAGGGSGVSLLVTSLLVAGGVLLGRWLGRAARPDEAPREPGTATPAPPEGAPGKPNEEDVVTSMGDGALFAGFPCTLGDVVIKVGGAEEAWLAGALVLVEDVPVAALFVAPEAGGDRAIYVRARPAAPTVTWLAPLAPQELVLGTEPPSSLEHDGACFDRVRRLPVRVRREGVGAPDVGERALLAEYAAPGASRLVVVLAQGRAHAWRGEALDEGMYDVLPSGRATL